MAVGGGKLGFCVGLSSYSWEVAVTWQEMASCDLATESDPEVMSFHRRLPASGCRRMKTHALFMFELLQGSNSHRVELT